jgi:hypothetical protein
MNILCSIGALLFFAVIVWIAWLMKNAVDVPKDYDEDEDDQYE